MALSSSSNWETLQILNSDMTTTFQLEPPPEPAMELPAYNSDGLDLPNTFIDPDSFTYAENYTDLLPYLVTPLDPLISLSPENFPYGDLDFDSYPSLKRQKFCYDNLYCSDFIPDGYLPEPEFSPELLIPSAHEYFNVPQVLNCSSTNVERTSSSSREVESNDSGRCNISAQSIAARQRRRKITEKTTELGKLIPGGNKMNTAEMLQAAFKYVKFLQAQVGILDSMDSIQECKNAEIEGEAQLLASPTIQEKLYLKEKCLVPKKFVDVLTKRQDLQSNPSISNHINRLLQS